MRPAPRAPRHHPELLPPAPVPAPRPAARGSVETLECRLLLDALPAPVPLGPEFRVNTTTRDYQLEPAVAADADGDFVVVWNSYHEGAAWNVYAQRYAADGTPRGGEFRVNQTAATAGRPRSVGDVATDADGDFVVVWTAMQAGGNDVYARRYAADGTPRGGEVLLNVGHTAGYQEQPSVAVDADGDYVVAWQSWDQDGGVATDVYARRYGADGAPRGAEFRVNREVPGNQYLPAVAADADGDFVVAWMDSVPGQSAHVEARAYRADGTPRAAEFDVSPPGQVNHTGHSVAMDEDGDFVVAWGAGAGGVASVFARRYNAAGEPAGPAAPALTGSRSQSPSAVAMDAKGNYVVAGLVSDGSDTGVEARLFDSGGAPRTEEFPVNTFAAGRQFAPAAAADRAGNFLLAWTSDGQDGDSGGIYARQYAAPAPPPATVVARQVFYNHGGFDGNDPAANDADDGAIATDKLALLAGQDRLPAFDNVTSYDKGINGVMVDVAGLPRGEGEGEGEGGAGPLTAEDFDFGGAGAPASVTVRRGAGTGGSDRVTLVWRDYNPQDASPLPQAVADGWLTVTVRANDRTGLAQQDVFSFGNLIAETGDPGAALGWRVNALDLAAVKRALNTPAAVTSDTDINRDGRTNALDLAAVKRNLGHALPLPTAPPAAAAADETGGRRTRVADEVLR